MRRRSRKRARIGLARYVGADAERPLGDPPDLARLPFDAAQARRCRRASRRSGWRARRRPIAATEADLARAAKTPDWSAELTYAVRGSPYSNMVSLMVSIDLPWSPGTRQDREHAAKLRELDAARAMREDTRRMRVAEVDAMLDRVGVGARTGEAHRGRDAPARRAAPRGRAGGVPRRHGSAGGRARGAPGRARRAARAH